MLSTDKQTNQRYQKHNLLCQGGNHTKLTIVSLGVSVNENILKILFFVYIITLFKFQKAKH